jgi:hypothetical protein
MLENIKNLLLIGWCAGGDPETAFLVAKANRCKGKIVAIIKAIKQDLVNIWHWVVAAPFIFAFDYAQYPNEPLKYAVNSLLQGTPMVCTLRALSGIDEACEIAQDMQRDLTGVLSFVSLKIEYAYKGEHFLITPKAK